MSQRAADNVEFIRINGEAVRVTSWTALNATTWRLVAIVRGSGDARALADLLANPNVEVEVPDQPVRAMTIVNVESRQAGEPPTVITRISADFEAGASAIEQPLQSLEDRMAQVERELANLQQIVRDLVNER